MSHKHEFIKSDKTGYEVCVSCGTYHSVEQDSPEQIYEAEEYWCYDNKRSKFEEQILNLNETEGTGISKIDIVLKYVPAHTKDVLEGGCAPGELLRQLTEGGYSAIGIEPSVRYIQPILEHAPKSKVIHGYFPQVFDDESNKELFDCLIFMDCFEHIDNTDLFIDTAYRLLRPGGALICMSPIVMADGKKRDIDFIKREHCWIYSQSFLDERLKEIFKEVKWDVWVNGHELFCAIK